MQAAGAGQAAAAGKVKGKKMGVKPLRGIGDSFLVCHTGEDERKNVIAAFTEKEDADHFLEWKKEKELFARNGMILDQIAAENGLDRSSPGIWPISITSPYYEKEREKIDQEYTMEQEAGKKSQLGQDMVSKEYIEREYHLAVLDFKVAHNEDEQWEARKTMARLEQIATQEHGFEYSDGLHRKELGVVRSGMILDQIAAELKAGIIQDIEGAGFRPTESLVKNMVTLGELTGEKHSLRAVVRLYRENQFQSNEAVSETVHKIAEECKAQELARMAQQAAGPVM